MQLSIAQPPFFWCDRSSSSTFFSSVTSTITSATEAVIPTVNPAVIPAVVPAVAKAMLELDETFSDPDSVDSLYTEVARDLHTRHGVDCAALFCCMGSPYVHHGHAGVHGNVFHVCHHAYLGAYWCKSV